LHQSCSGQVVIVLQRLHNCLNPGGDFQCQGGAKLLEFGNSRGGANATLAPLLCKRCSKYETASRATDRGKVQVNLVLSHKEIGCARALSNPSTLPSSSDP